MSDYPMLISNKLHSFRNFNYTKLYIGNCFLCCDHVVLGLMGKYTETGLQDMEV